MTENEVHETEAEEGFGSVNGEEASEESGAVEEDTTSAEASAEAEPDNAPVADKENEEKKSSSIIPSKYRDRPKTDDWLTDFMESQCTNVEEKTFPEKKDKEGNIKEAARTEEVRVFDLEKIYALALANGVPQAKIDNYRANSRGPSDVGRMRMTVGNMLRARGRRRHGLNDLEGNFVEADEAFVAGHSKTENPDGTKIKREEATEQTQSTEAAA